MGFFGDIVKGVTKSALRVNSFEFVKDRAPNQIGVYIMSFGGRVMYVGRAIEDRLGQSTRGLRKRLQEHWRGAANCKPELFRYKDKITVKLVACETVSEAKKLEGQLIRKYDTVEKGWNLRYEG